MPDTRQRHAYGYLPSLMDARDYYYSYPAGTPVPDRLDWRTEFLPTILDQGQLGSCTANAGEYALQYADYFNGKTPEDISRLFQYYQERVIEHSTASDAGANMRDIFKVMQKYGVVPEKLWPYDINKFADKPPKAVYAAAKTDKIKAYERVHQVRSLLQACLAARRTFVIGIGVYESFESAEVAKTGMVPMPDLSREALLGGHAIHCCGYDNKNEHYTFLNSWGAGWGDKGAFYLPYAYVENPQLASDIWTLTTL